VYSRSLNDHSPPRLAAYIISSNPYEWHDRFDLTNVNAPCQLNPLNQIAQDPRPRFKKANTNDNTGKRSSYTDALHLFIPPTPCPPDIAINQKEDLREIFLIRVDTLNNTVAKSPISVEKRKSFYVTMMCLFFFVKPVKSPLHFPSKAMQPKHRRNNMQCALKIKLSWWNTISTWTVVSNIVVAPWLSQGIGDVGRRRIYTKDSLRWGEVP